MIEKMVTAGPIAGFRRRIAWATASVPLRADHLRGHAAPRSRLAPPSRPRPSRAQPFVARTGYIV